MATNTILIDCNQQQSVEAQSGNATSNAIWTNKVSEGLMLMLGLFLFVALGVLGCADLASLGVDACGALSFDLDYFAGGFWWHYVRRCDNDLGTIL